MLLTQCCDIPVPRITSTQLLIEPSNACKILARYLVIFAPSPLDASFDICLINLTGVGYRCCLSVLNGGKVGIISNRLDALIHRQVRVQLYPLAGIAHKREVKTL